MGVHPSERVNTRRTRQHTQRTNSRQLMRWEVVLRERKCEEHRVRPSITNIHPGVEDTEIALKDQHLKVSFNFFLHFVSLDFQVSLIIFAFSFPPLLIVDDAKRPSITYIQQVVGGSPIKTNIWKSRP
ncbi:hypothetical protein AAC387_Pa07g3144 [Persea americana]